MEQRQFIATRSEYLDAIDLILDEFHKSQSKYPDWPIDLLHRAMILNEESGEISKACLDFIYHGGELNDIIIETAQTGAMAIRLLASLMRWEQKSIMINELQNYRKKYKV